MTLPATTTALLGRYGSLLGPHYVKLIVACCCTLPGLFPPTMHSAVMPYSPSQSLAPRETPRRSILNRFNSQSTPVRHPVAYKNEPQMDRCLIFARDAENISISGSGRIDGQGHREKFPNKGSKHRPMMIRLLQCKNIRIRDIKLDHPAAWTSVWLYNAVASKG